MRKILFVMTLSAAAVGVHSMRADAGCGGGAVSAKAKAGIMIPFVPPKQGQLATLSDDESMKGTLSIDGKSSPIDQTVTRAYTEEIIAVNGESITKAKVTFTAAHMISDGMGRKTDADMPVKGKAYVVAADSGKPTVTVDGGAAAAASEAEIVLKVERHVGEPDKLGKLLSAKSFVKGEQVTLGDDELAAFMGSNEGMTASKVTLTLTGSDAKSASFVLTGTVAGKQGGIDMTIAFKGVAKVDLKTSRPIDFSMTGTIKGGGDLGGKKIEMNGTITAHKMATYKN